MLLSGCQVLRWPMNLFKGQAKDKQEQQYNTHELLKRQPKVVRVEKNIFGQENCYIGEEITHEIITNYRQQQKELPLVDKLLSLGWKWLVVFGIFTVLGLIFPPIAIFLGIGKRAATSAAYAARDKIYERFGNVVKTIDKAAVAMTPEEKEKLFGTLSKDLDSDTKLMIAEIKHKGTGSGS